MKTNHCDKRRPGIGQVVKGIGPDRYRAADETGRVFAREQQDIQRDANNTAENAVGLANICIGCVVFIRNKTVYKKCEHNK
jgi:hypothetical protein